MRYAAMLRARRGALMGPLAGATLVAQAERALAEEGVKVPRKMLDVFIPGDFGAA